MSDLDRRLAAVAGKQRMLITIADVHAVGGNKHNISRRVSAGRWTRVDRGVHLVAGAPFDWTTRLLAAVLGAGDGAVASHFAAARLWGLAGFGRAFVELSIPRGGRFRRNGIRTHESTDLDRCKIVRRDGVPVTDPDRTILDVARYVGIKRLTRVVEGARRAELVTWSSLISTLARHARRGRPGIRRLRAVILAGAHREEVTDTDVELMVLGLLTEAGLPEPLIHHRIEDGERFVAEVDLAYPQWRIAIECDGDIHLLPEVRERDLPRQNDLVLTGWTVLRFSRDRVWTRPEAIVAEVLAAVADRRRASRAA